MRSGSRCPAFYGEIPPMRWGILNDDGGYFYCITYIYQDLSVDYVLKMATSLPDVFAHSAYQHIQMPRIKARARMQNAFYAKAAGIFTMGKWLVKELEEDRNISVKDKVHHVGGV